MSLSFLCEETSWSKHVYLPVNDLLKATLEKQDFFNQLTSLITLSVRLIRKEIVNVESLPNINTHVKLLEEFVFNLNEIHASSDEALPDFDVKITPLIYTYAELVVFQSRLGDCQKEYEEKLVRYLNSLPIHPTFHNTPCHRTAAFLTSVLSDGYGRPPEKSDIITHSIVSLTPYQNKWTVKVRIINKSDIRSYSKNRGEGKFFTIDMIDKTGEIRAIAFNAECDKFYHMIEIGKIFYISQAQLKAANKQYSSMRNDYEMSFNRNTTVIPCHDDTSDIPSITFNFVPIDQLPSLDKDSVIDVIGVVKSAKDVRVIVPKTTNKEVKMREVQMVDRSNTVVNLTLWGEIAEEFDASSQPVVALKGAKLSDFEGEGRSLKKAWSTVVQINPDLSEAHSLRGWYDNGGSSLIRQMKQPEIVYPNC